MAKSSSNKNTPTHQKRITNRFDQYEICHVFTESSQQYLEQSNKPIQAKFYVRAVIGVILAVNAYLSHWGPWPWPENYYVIFSSIFIYYIGSTIYSKLSPVDNCEGNFIGEFDYKGSRKIFTMKISQSKTEYIFHIMDAQTKKTIGQKAFIYYEYFTEKGIFLEKQYHKNLSGFLATLK